MRTLVLVSCAYVHTFKLCRGARGRAATRGMRVKNTNAGTDVECETGSDDIRPSWLRNEQISRGSSVQIPLRFQALNDVFPSPYNPLGYPADSVSASTDVVKLLFGYSTPEAANTSSIRSCSTRRKARRRGEVQRGKGS